MPEASIDIDAASVLHLGSRETQEDAIATDFPVGGACGLVVLADGMGGHSSGEIASKIAVTEVYSELKLSSSKFELDRSGIPDVLKKSVAGANECLRRHTEVYPETVGMGTTLIAMIQMYDALHWISVGDSLLLLFRDGKLRRLNADHSLAPQIDLMVENGELPQEVAKKHPQRSCLTSAMTGEPIPKIDCPDMPLRLLPGDIIIVASDGLQALSDDAMASVLAERSDLTSNQIARALLEAVIDFDDPHQDNLSCAVAMVFDSRQSQVEPVDVAAPQVPLPDTVRADADTSSLPFGSPPPRRPILHRLRQIAGSLF